MAGGFKHVGTESQGDVTGKVQRFHVAAAHSTLLSPGDVVTITGTADTDGTPQVDTGVAGSATTGVILSVEPIFTGEQLSETGLPASTEGYVFVNTDPFALYEVDVENGPLVVANTGLNGNIVANVATKSGGLTQSNMTLNATGIATTATLNFRIKKLLTGTVFGDRALVRMNNSTVNAGTAGV